MTRRRDCRYIGNHSKKFLKRKLSEIMAHLTDSIPKLLPKQTKSMGAISPKALPAKVIVNTNALVLKDISNTQALPIHTQMTPTSKINDHPTTSLSISEPDQ
ncbi:hypothetical protein Nepgr_018138 [Nepenthes gracilis]|uniref:Uncharacterized protein n=1 Tax=Nepenthes gracilis TaxID=150966 RepID=A0AAD3SSF5_NEPGR|nr:hypothetical protein Nepgr_018138 [Nepenthes gracilis]